MFSVGDVVQVTDNKHPWYPCLMIVGEVKDWGVQAAVLIPGSNVENRVGEAWNRMKNDQVTRIGTVFISIEEVEYVTEFADEAVEEEKE